MLKMTGVKLEKIFDINMYLFTETGLRRGISYISKRYSKANNKYYDQEDYDPTKPSKCISCLDMNNLYGWAMSGYLPYGGFKWLKNVDNFDVNSVTEKSPVGYNFNDDLKYPVELHILHNDYPLAPEKLAIPSEMLSDYCQKIADEYEIKVGDVMKLVPNLGGKANYVLHYRNLQFYLSLGMKLTKIHRALKFKQSDWMKKYILILTVKKEKMVLIVLKKVFLN